jgi:hypothetical protein
MTLTFPTDMGGEMSPPSPSLRIFHHPSGLGDEVQKSFKGRFCLPLSKSAGPFKFKGLSS